MIGSVITSADGKPIDGNGKALEVSAYNPPEAIKKPIRVKFYTNSGEKVGFKAYQTVGYVQSCSCGTCPIHDAMQGITTTSSNKLPKYQMGEVVKQNGSKWTRTITGLKNNYLGKKRFAYRYTEDFGGGMCAEENLTRWQKNGR